MIEGLSNAIEQFHFLRPWWWLALPVGLFIGWMVRRRANRSEWQLFIASPLLEALLTRPKSDSPFTPVRLANAMVLLWVLALTGPSWQREASPLVDDKAPLVIAMYLGDSLLKEDLLPNRLTHVKLKVAEILNQRVGSPTALLVYGETAHSVLPLTEDVDILKTYLQDLEPNVVPRAGNRPDNALAKAAEVLADAGGSVVLVGDSLEDFLAPQINWNPLPSRVNVSFLAVAPVLDDQAVMRKTLHSAGIDMVNITIDDADTNRLLETVERHWQSQLSQRGDVQWRDAGYYLVWPLLLIALVWYRRGMVLQ